MKKRTNKSISLLLVSIMIISSLISLMTVSKVFAEDNSFEVNSDNNVTDLMEIVDSDDYELEEELKLGEDFSNEILNEETTKGKKINGIVTSIDIIIGDKDKVNENSNYTVSVEFDASNENLKSGDYFEIDFISDNLTTKLSTDNIDLVNEKTGSTIGKVVFENNKAIVTFNDAVDDISNIGGGFFMSLSSRFNDNEKGPKDGIIKVKSDEIEAEVVIYRPESGDSTDNLFYKSGYTHWDASSKTYKAYWVLGINSAFQSFDGKESNFIIKDRLEDTMLWDKETILNKKIVTINNKNGSQPNGSELTISQAKEQGININLEDNLIEVSIKDIGKGHPLNEKSVFIHLDAEIKNEVINDFNIKQLVNEVDLRTDLIGWNDNKVVEKASIEIARSYGYGFGTKKGELKLFKKITDTDIPIPGVKFQIRNDKTGYQKEFTTDEEGFIFVGNLSEGKYTLKEVDVPSGIIKSGKEYKFEIKSTDDIGIEYIIENDKAEEEFKTTNISAKKVWKGINDDNYPKVTFELYRIKEDESEEKIETIKLEGENPTHTWENLPLEYKENNEIKRYKYEVREAKVTEDNKVKIENKTYKVEIESSITEEEGMDFIITNTLEKENPKPDKPTTDTPDKPKEETKPSYPNKNEPERPGSSIPDIPNRPKNPNKKDPIKPEEPVIEEPNKPLEEEPKDVIISDSKVDPNKSEKEVEKEEITEKDKVVKSNNQVVSNKLDPNKAPQTGDVFNIGRSLLVIFASISALFIISKKKKEN